LTGDENINGDEYHKKTPDDDGRAALVQQYRLELRPNHSGDILVSFSLIGTL
jgi:hypothetical protein